MNATCLRGHQKLLQTLSLLAAMALTFGLMGLVQPQTVQAQTVKEILTFPGYNFAFGGLTLDSAGNLYGTTNVGGTGTVCGPNGCGTVLHCRQTPAAAGPKPCSTPSLA